MKRVLSAVLLLLCLIPSLICTAADDLYAEYTPKSANSSVFYVDVFSGREVTAAVFELSFPDSMVSYYSVVAGDSAASVRDNPQSGKVTVAFADDSPCSGKLCRFSFKALQTGSVSFVLHMKQAAGADKKLLSSWSDYTLSIKLGKDDIAQSDSVKRSGGSSSSSASKNGRGEKSSLNTGDGDDDLASPGIFDLSHGDPTLKWLLLGAGIPLLLGALVWIGVLIGRRSNDKKDRAKEKPGEELPEPDKENIDNNDEAENDSSTEE